MSTKKISYSYEFNCKICRSLLFQPYKTECDHYFCGACLKAELKKADICPDCSEQVLPGTIQKALELETRIRRNLNSILESNSSNKNINNNDKNIVTSFHNDKEYDFDRILSFHEKRRNGEETDDDDSEYGTFKVLSMFQDNDKEEAPQPNNGIRFGLENILALFPALRENGDDFENLNEQFLRLTDRSDEGFGEEIL